MKWNVSAILLVFLTAVVLGEPPQVEEQVQKLKNGITADRYREHLELLSGKKPVQLEGESTAEVIPDRFRTANIKRARNYLMEKLKAAGYPMVHVEKFELRRHSAPYFTGGTRPEGLNIWVEITGETDELVVYGAHYDTTGKHRPGANDNGSGVAAVLTAAEQFIKLGVKPKRTIRFLFIDAEEMLGYEGSRYHFKRAFDRREKLKLFINLDMIGNSPSGKPYAAFDPGQFNTLGDLLESANRMTGMGFKFDLWNGYASDQRPAQERGVPAMSFFEDPRDDDGEETGYYPFYHSADDTVDKVNIPYATKLTQLSSSAIWIGANSDLTWDTANSQRIYARYLERRGEKARSRFSACIARVLSWGRQSLDWIAGS